jgi:hypothetical protein
MTDNRDERYRDKETKDRIDKCFMGVEEATKERQKIIDKEPYS